MLKAISSTILASGGKIREIFENDDITVSGLKWRKNDSSAAIFLPIRLQKMLILFCSYAQVNVQLAFLEYGYLYQWSGLGGKDQEFKFLKDGIHREIG